MKLDSLVLSERWSLSIQEACALGKMMPISFKKDLYLISLVALTLITFPIVVVWDLFLIGILKLQNCWLRFKIKYLLKYIVYFWKLKMRYRLWLYQIRLKKS